MMFSLSHKKLKLCSSSLRLKSDEKEIFRPLKSCLWLGSGAQMFPSPAMLYGGVVWLGLAFNKTDEERGEIRRSNELTVTYPPMRRNRDINLEHNKRIAAGINLPQRKRAFKDRHRRMSLVGFVFGWGVVGLANFTSANAPCRQLSFVGSCLLSAWLYVGFCFVLSCGLRSLPMQ